MHSVPLSPSKKDTHQCNVIVFELGEGLSVAEDFEQEREHLNERGGYPVGLLQDDNTYPSRPVSGGPFAVDRFRQLAVKRILFRVHNSGPPQPRCGDVAGFVEREGDVGAVGEACGKEKKREEWFHRVETLGKKFTVTGLKLDTPDPAAASHRAR